MTVETETILIKFLERIEAESKETNRKLGRVIEDVNKVNVNLARLEGEIKTLQVEVTNVKEDLREFKSEVKEDIKELKTELKEVRSENKETKNEVSGLYKWVIGTGIVAVIGVANIFLKFFDLLPKA